LQPRLELVISRSKRGGTGIFETTAPTIGIDQAFHDDFHRLDLVPVGAWIHAVEIFKLGLKIGDSRPLELE
jgi:hypothetical protein